MSKAESDAKTVQDDEVWELIYGWWADLQKPGLRGERAVLRRSRSPDQVSMCLPFFNLYRKLQGSVAADSIKGRLPYNLPIVAGILSHINEDRSQPVARSMASGRNDRPVVSDIRFRRLIRTDGRDELYIMMIRMIRMLDGFANVRDMARSLFFWNDRTKQRWASEYYLKKDQYNADEGKNTTKEGDEQ